MRKSLIAAVFVLALFAALPASAQNVRVDGIALNRGGLPAPGANVAVCSPQPANTTTTPCTPAANLCSSLTDTLCGQSNVVQADGLGNYRFYIANGTVYTLQLYGSGVTTRVQPDQQAGGGFAGGFICGTTITPGLPYWNGTACAIDTGATFDPINIQWNFENIVSSGTITAAKFATSGAGGILEMKSQAAPTPGAGLFDLYIDSGTGQLGCRNSVPASCLAAVQTIASGTATMGTAAIASGVCAAAVTATATGTLTTDRIVATPNVDPTGVSGYGPSASGSLYIQVFPTANTVSFKVCNNTSGSITPAALTLNWAVLR